jgi:ABC-type glycerol-3-phosphate transport system permease component
MWAFTYTEHCGLGGQPPQTFYNEMAAASFVSMVPLALFFALAGRYMVRGLTMGAVK